MTFALPSRWMSRKNTCTSTLAPAVTATAPAMTRAMLAVFILIGTPVLLCAPIIVQTGAVAADLRSAADARLRRAPAFRPGQRDAHDVVLRRGRRAGNRDRAAFLDRESVAVDKAPARQDDAV